MTANYNKYEEWMKAKAKLDYYKALESNLRDEIVEMEGVDKMKIGTNNVVNGPYVIKIVKKVSTSIDKEALSFVEDDLSDEEKDAIKWSPSIDAKKYKELDDTDVIDQAIVVKPAKPSLSITHVEEQ